jgi:hypothetical protein
MIFFKPFFFFFLLLETSWSLARELEVAGDVAELPDGWPC